MILKWWSCCSGENMGCICEQGKNWTIKNTKKKNNQKEHGQWGFPGKNIGVGCHFLLQGIFLT